MDDRTEIAKTLLAEMMHTRGEKHDKVRIAVEYTDLLLTELETVRPRRHDGPENSQPVPRTSR